MLRKGKTNVGVAAIAALAMSAALAPVANAQHVGWQAGATAFKATQDPAAPSQVIKVTAGAAGDTCNGVHASGNLVGDLPGGNSAKTVSTTNLDYTHAGLPENKCTGPLETEPKIEINSCGYTFHGETTITDDEVTASVDIVCSGANEITTNGGALCTVHIPPQNGLEHVLFKTETPLTNPETVTGDATVTGIKYKHTGLCGNGEGSNGTYDGKFTVTATDFTGVEKHLTIT